MRWGERSCEHINCLACPAIDRTMETCNDRCPQYKWDGKTIKEKDRTEDEYVKLINEMRKQKE